MSTRGCVAVVSSDTGWRGVYNHSDSYPTYLAQEELWPRLAGKSVKALKAFARALFQAGRFENLTHPGSRTIEHDENGNNIDEMTDKNACPLFIEWIYILDPERQTLRILASHGGSKEGTWQPEPSVSDTGEWDYGDWISKHVEITTISLTGPEPNWEAIEQRRRSEC